MKKLLSFVAVVAMTAAVYAGSVPVQPKVKLLTASGTNSWTIETNSIVYLRNFSFSHGTNAALTGKVVTVKLTRLGIDYTLASENYTGTVTAVTSFDPYRILDGKIGDKLTVTHNAVISAYLWLEIVE
jgi:hypothetical protein